MNANQRKKNLVTDVDEILTDCKTIKEVGKRSNTYEPNPNQIYRLRLLGRLLE